MTDSIPAASALFYSLLGGILPALLWLWFWTREDKLHPEPRSRIMLTFIAGMIAVPLVYFPQRWAYDYFGTINSSLLLAWAVIEELMKYIVVGFAALRSRDYDEPIDAMEYMVTGALGFAALENVLFILNPFLTNEPMQQIFMGGNMRFLGASLLHVVCSAVLGYCIGREFYRPRIWKNIWRVIGLSLAIALHALFNLFIIYENGSKTFLVFSCVWMVGIVVLLLFEKIKQVRKNN
jgi:RsiW-degrading membrane proteinase PrsW (M82 family)